MGTDKHEICVAVYVFLWERKKNRGLHRTNQSKIDLWCECERWFVSTCDCGELENSQMLSSSFCLLSSAPALDLNLIQKVNISLSFE